MVVLPSDHFIRNRDLFHYLVRAAVDVAETGYLVTLGITPTYPLDCVWLYPARARPWRGISNIPRMLSAASVEKPDDDQRPAIAAQR